MGKIKKKVVKSVTKNRKVDVAGFIPDWPSDIEYVSLFNNCVIAKEHVAEVDMIIDRRILPGKARYESVALGASSRISISDTQPFSVLARSEANESRGRFYNQDLLRNVIADNFGPSPMLLNVNDWRRLNFSIDQQIEYEPFHIGGDTSGLFRLTPRTGRMIPWYVVAVIHNMEGNCNFNVHIHNGDPLTGFTTHYPPGHPHVGHKPPFTWEESAIDALTTVRHFDKVSHWNLPKMLSVIENYNGAAYRLNHRYTPYLWSYSNLFVKGKFVKDHMFDPEAGSSQAGAAVVLKRMEERHLIYIPRW